MSTPPSSLELRPARGTVARWAAATLGALAAFVWVFVDSEGHPFAWIAVTFAAIVAAYFTAQLLAPSRFRVLLDQDGLRAWFLWSTAEVRWDEVHLARVSTLAGEPFLELDLRDPEAPDEAVRTRGVMLPVGVDLESLHGFLAQRLGTAGSPPRRTFPALDRDEETR